MNKEKFYLNSKLDGNLNYNSLTNQTRSFHLNNSKFDKIAKDINQQNQKIINLIKTIDENRYQEQKQFHQYYLQLLNSSSKQYNQEILNQISSLKQQFTNLEQYQTNNKSIQKTNYDSCLPSIQSVQLEKSKDLKIDQLNTKQKYDSKNKFMKSSSIYEKETQNQNLQIQQKKKSNSTYKKTQQNYSNQFITKTEASPPESSERNTTNSQKLQSVQIKRQQKLNNFNQFQESQKSLIKQSEKQSLLNTQYDQDKKRKLLRKFKAVSRVIWLSVTLLQYCQKIWYQNYMTFKDWAQELIGQYDSQFNYKLVMDKFYKECQLKRLVDKSWVIKSQSDIQIKCHNILIVLEIFFKNLIIQSLDLSVEHINFIQKFSLKKGYLLSGHSRFVVNRINIRPNNTLKQLMNNLLKMIILEYSYIQLLLPLIAEGDYWLKMPNYKETLKIFISILHYLFIETFQNLPQFKQECEINQDKDWVLMFDFSRNPMDGFHQLINQQHPKFTINNNAVALGLYSKVELHPIILHNGYKNIQDSFKQYCNAIYSLIL